MSYRDTLVTCANCGKEFIFRVEEQRRQAERGEEIVPPELCPACRPGGSAERRPEPERKPRPEPRAEKKVDETVALLPGSSSNATYCPTPRTWRNSPSRSRLAWS